MVQGGTLEYERERGAGRKLEMEEVGEGRGKVREEEMGGEE